MQLGQQITDEPRQAEGEEYLYRYVEILYSTGTDQFDNPYPGSNLDLRLEKHRVLRRTPKGAWIEDDRGFPRRVENSKDGTVKWIKPERFVLLTARKQFASETKEKALESFRARKRRQLKILKSRAKVAEAALVHAERMLEAGGERIPMTYVP
jgi:hypothetical protein